MTDTTVIRCSHCGASNRVPQDKLAQGLTPKCGQCKAPLVAATGPMTVTDATFAADVERSPLPVLVDAWAPWCGPCRMVGPIVDELATELAGKVRVAKLNVDDNPGIAARFDVRSIPTMLVMVNGREVDRIVGALPKAAIRARLDRVIAQ
ncbi:MAG: thioredoxin TrxC [Gammaproteobacteria bacterium]